MSRPPHSLDQPKRRRATWLILGGIAILCCAAVAVVVGVALVRDSDSGSDGQDSRPAGDVSGDLADWIGAVCERGTLRDGSSIVQGSNATTASSCQAQIHPGASSNNPVLIIRFDSAAHMLYDLDKSRIQFYAFTVRDGEWIAFAPVGLGGDEQLKPLKQFGFEIVRA